MGESKNEFSNNAELGIDELDVVAGGAGGANGAELDGSVVGHLPNGIFQVQLDDGTTAMCNLSGQLRMNYIRVLPGDRVRVEMDSGDPSRGRIVWRSK
jgi:translation initiation factor IF-1